MSERRLVAAVACRNQGSRLYGKPLQNLDVASGHRIIDHLLDCLATIESIDEVVLGIAEGVENDVFKRLADARELQYIVGDEIDVLGRLIACGQLAGATDIFRVTSESPFLYFEEVENCWKQHVASRAAGTFMDQIVDGCGFEIISLAALEESHLLGEDRHRSELCSLYLRENDDKFKLNRVLPDAKLTRFDLRLTVDNPEDLVVCRAVYASFKARSPRISVPKIIEYLDEHPELIELTAPYAQAGYQTMNL
jgi:spore coat polysaccharide biosynthesis protein SpsF